MWSFLYHETKTFNFLTIFLSGGHDIDARSVDAAVPQDIRKLSNIFLDAVKCPGEELA